MRHQELNRHIRVKIHEGILRLIIHSTLIRFLQV